jgi:hypothetical protein
LERTKEASPEGGVKVIETGSECVSRSNHSRIALSWRHAIPAPAAGGRS